MTTKLRMKNTSEDIEIILKQERKQRKKRRKEESRTRINDSITPPRIPSTSTSTSTYIFDHEDIGFDESNLPPFKSRKPENYDTSSSENNNNNNRNQQNNNNRNFNEKLRDAMEEDEGIGYQEELLYSREASRTAASFSYGGAASIAMGFSSSRNNATLNGLEMDEEEYAEMVRAGMWRLKNKDEAERRDAALKAYKEKELKEKLETEQRKKEERERIKKLEEKVKKRAAKDDIDARKRYEDLWKKILKIPVVKLPPEVPPPSTLDEEPIEGPLPLPPPLNPLRFTDFPWPLYPPVPFPPLSWPSTNDITATAISTFLLSHVSSKDKKSTLRTAVLAYHPDRFDRLLSRIPEDKIEVKERVKELGLRVSQVLNDLLKAGGN